MTQVYGKKVYLLEKLGMYGNALISPNKDIKIKQTIMKCRLIQKLNGLHKGNKLLRQHIMVRPDYIYAYYCKGYDL